MCDVSRPALVLGSVQPVEDVDGDALERAGLDLARRRSGGGAVLVEPGRIAWVDVVVPAGDPLWDSDVSRAFWWLGEVWVAAAGALGVGGAVAHRGGLVRSRWSSLVCFAGLGPGEVTAEGRKVVGLSQRRTRSEALFQCGVPLRWEPDRLVDALSLAPGERAAASADLAGAVRGLPGVSAGDVVDAFLDALP